MKSKKKLAKESKKRCIDQRKGTDGEGARATGRNTLVNQNNFSFFIWRRSASDWKRLGWAVVVVLLCLSPFSVAM